MIKTMGSDEARLKWRDTLDAAQQGETTVVERYGKPIAAIVSHDEWQRLQRAHRAEVQRRLEEEPDVPWSEVEQGMIDRGLLDAVDH